ncbi:protein of unknown function [Methylocaldum szegediense]|uniref:Integrase catalytic domain-containing protein n=1 Tax=Methylocaldum szegediense TaxID=73780 RepID=A0ABM9HXS6_9GAMM|nr:protein of unknown function [Methylocaldum szegediense]
MSEPHSSISIYNKFLAFNFIPSAPLSTETLIILSNWIVFYYSKPANNIQSKYLSNVSQIENLSRERTRQTSSRCRSRCLPNWFFVSHTSGNRFLILFSTPHF